MSPLDSIDVLSEFPFRVSYPKAGELYLLYWFTQWGRGHVLASPLEDRIERMLRRVFIEHGPEVELREYWKASLVSAPKELREGYARGRLREDMDQFRWFVGNLFSAASAKDHPAKKEARRCSNYESTYGAPSKDDKEHVTCINCFKGWVPKNESVESLYVRRRHEPRNFGLGPSAWQSKRKTGIPEPAVSVAPEADLTKPLYALEQRFGDHSDGLKISTVEKDEEGLWPWRTHYHCPPITFLFQGEKLTVPKAFQSLAKTARTDHKREEAEKLKKRRDEVKQDRVDANERLRRLLAP